MSKDGSVDGTRMVGLSADSQHVEDIKSLGELTSWKVENTDRPSTCQAGCLVCEGDDSRMQLMLLPVERETLTIAWRLCKSIARPF